MLTERHDEAKSRLPSILRTRLETAATVLNIISANAQNFVTRRPETVHPCTHPFHSEARAKDIHKILTL